MSLSIKKIALTLALCALPLTVLAQSEGFFAPPEQSHLYRQLPEIENKLYGHAYLGQALSQRIVRIEKTLFGKTQGGPTEQRFEQIVRKMDVRDEAKTIADEEPLIAYLEEKLFQRTYNEADMPKRMHQLETHVFGKAFDHYPLPVRIKKLTYAMPIVAKEIRLTSGDRVIASTRRTTAQTSRTRPAAPETVSLDASHGTPMHPSGMAVSTGSYFQGVHRQQNGKYLRWEKLPVKVFSQSSTDAEESLTKTALSLWRAGFESQLVDSEGEADIIVRWHPNASQHSDGLITRPILHLDNNRSIRTVIMINMAPFASKNAAQKRHALLHQLGHAFGLWGHSNQTGDVMYPALKEEAADIPTRWRERSKALPSAPSRASALSEKPSQRDINTLIEVYEKPAQVISDYSGY